MAMPPARSEGITDEQIVRLVFRLFLGIGIVAAVIGVALVPLTPEPLIWAVGWIALIVAIRALSFWLIRKEEGPVELKQEGVAGVATVLEAVRTKRSFQQGGPGTGKRVYRMRLRVEAEGIPAYEIEKSIPVDAPPDWIAPGRQLPVFVDREKRDKILVDWEGLRAASPGVEVSPGVVIRTR